MENSKLFVGNLPYKTSEAQLTDLFAPFGSVVEAFIPLDRATGRARGFAFVTMGSQEEAEKAIAGLTGQNFEGRELTINIARPKGDR